MHSLDLIFFAPISREIEGFQTAINPEYEISGMNPILESYQPTIVSSLYLVWCACKRGMSSGEYRNTKVVKLALRFYATSPSLAVKVSMILILH